MSNTTLDYDLQMRTKPIEHLTEAELIIRVCYDLIKENNFLRKRQGNSGLQIDDYCSRAAKDLTSKLTNLSIL